MNDEARKRLDRLLQQLKEIDEASSGRLQCAVISSTLSSPIHDQSVWQWVARFVREPRPREANIVLDPQPLSVQPSEDGKACVRWCGDPEKREAFKQWVVRLSGLFKSHPELVPDLEPRYGVEGGLEAICAIASAGTHYPDLVKKRRILDLARKRILIPKPPKRLTKIDVKPSFDVIEIDDLAPRFSLKVFSRLLGKPIDSPLRVEFDGSAGSQDAIIVVNGERFFVDRECGLVVEQLLSANGTPLSQPRMIQNDPALKGIGRVKRLFGKKRNRLPFKLGSDRRGFWLPPSLLK